MSRIEQLPSDQSAVLSLLLRQRKTYAEVAGMLAIKESAVQDRAYEAIVALGADEGTSLLRTHRQEIGDYLLGQRESLSHSTRTYLRTLPNGRIWANEVRSQLQEITAEALPQIPSDQPAKLTVDEYAATQISQEPLPAVPQTHRHTEEPADRISEVTTGETVSRRGGALLLAGILIVVVVAVILIVGGGSGGGSHSGKSASSTTTTSTSKTAASTSSGIHIDAQLSLVPTEPGSTAKGAVEIASEGSKHAFDVIAEKLPPSNGFFYVAWLYNSPSHAEPLGRAPAVNSNGKLQAAGALPANLGEYHEMILTRETNEHPTRPGVIVLKGALDLNTGAGGAASAGSASSEAAGGAGEASAQSSG